MSIRSLFVSNRGEIACRILSGVPSRIIETYTCHTSEDIGARHTRLADSSIHLGESSDLYLDIDSIISAAKSTTCDAIHPGYGFLSENADFAERVEQAGLIFVGPPPEAIRLMGQKDIAKRLMSDSGIPVVPGYTGESQSAEHLKSRADELGYPLLIKAVSGGGGRGMRKVESPSDFADALSSACRESQNAFGDDRVILERYISNPRHIEFQIFADSHNNVVHLFERDCSLQRRHQKIIEESPAPYMTDELRSLMGEVACNAARAVNYEGAGTIEFIVDSGDDRCTLTPENFWFMEMNTRLQVEHRVTEQVTGIDLLDWQLKVADGEKLPMSQSEIKQRGHSIEARIYAEDSLSGFLPSSGKIVSLSSPEPSSRQMFDAGYESGDTLSSYYDSLIAKWIVHADDRSQAITDLIDVLCNTHIFGISTNLTFLSTLLSHVDFTAGIIDTGLIERDLPTLLSTSELSPNHIAIGVAELLQLESPTTTTTDPWTYDAFQLFGTRCIDYSCRINDESHTFPVRFISSGIEVYIDESWITPKKSSSKVLTFPSLVYVLSSGVHSIFAPAVYEYLASDISGDGIITSPFHGRILSVLVSNGDRVSQGDLLFCLEAMKMENSIYAPFAGEISDLRIEQGDQVEAGSISMIIK